MIKIAGKKHWLWRAVDQDGIVLDILVQSRRDKRAAKRFLRKLLKKQRRPPRVLITDKLASYGAAKGEVMPSVEHRKHKGLNNRAENSHQPTRRRERQMKRFKSARQVQRFLSAHDQINNLFHLRRDHVTASEYRAARTRAFQTWGEVTEQEKASLRDLTVLLGPTRPDKIGLGKALIRWVDTSYFLDDQFTSEAASKPCRCRTRSRLPCRHGCRCPEERRC